MTTGADVTERGGMTTVIVMAKACEPGRVKTRLTPPYTPAEAARIAAASLADTLAFVQALPVTRRVLCIDGPAPAAPGFEVQPQADGGLDERIAAALDGCRGPALVLGMDTPQLQAADVDAPLRAWATGAAEADAWLGPAADGGFWALGLTRPDGALVRGVRMSRADTGAHQLGRLWAAGLRVQTLPLHTDLDDAASLRVVRAAASVDGRLQATLAELDAAGAGTDRVAS
ncbi:TIGR04282 family arsenosugar biosynthesis glycosyltransferase [Microbacterium luticocti]|uniref:TIGR04282 family arsenosugar biosynthesis glycosyltransferase n=1 Tax=Microbacterium luticocti TaxID=451764 RepID=UPI0003FD2680|nr:DUF2064 domain-containing protein [Microbacterium luticocti]